MTDAMKRLILALALLGMPLPAAEPANEVKLRPIGRVEKSDGKTEVVIDDRFTAGLRHLDRYSHVWVIYWLDRNDNPGDRAVLEVIPRGNRDNPVAGVFACRSQYRPNLVALSLCRIKRIQGNRVVIESIDAFDDSPVIDLKPYVPAIDSADKVRTANWKPPESDDP